MQNNELSRIADVQIALGEVAKSLLKLNDDLFWLLLQHVSTEELQDQLAERQRIVNIYSKIAD